MSGLDLRAVGGGRPASCAAGLAAALDDAQAAPVAVRETHCVEELVDVVEGWLDSRLAARETRTS